MWVLLKFDSVVGPRDLEGQQGHGAQALGVLRLGPRTRSRSLCSLIVRVDVGHQLCEQHDECCGEGQYTRRVRVYNDEYRL